MPIHERGAERRIRLRQHEARAEEARPPEVATSFANNVAKGRTLHVGLEAREAERRETEQKTAEIREALKELERTERRAETKRKVARARLHQALEEEEAAREHRLAEDLPGPDAINAITDEEARMHAYEKSFGIAETQEPPKREIPKIVSEAMPSLAREIKRPVAEAHFQQKIEEAKNILGQEKAAAIWEEILPLLGRDGDAATRYVFEFATIAKDAKTKDAEELKGDIEALNEKYDLPSTYNPMRAETQKRKKPPIPSEPRQPPRAGPEVVTAQNVEHWRGQLIALNENLHEQIADLSTRGVPHDRIEAVSDRIRATEAELAKIEEYKDIGTDLAGEAISYELRLKEMAKRMDALSDQIRHVYGKTPEELRSLGGVGMFMARVKNRLSKFAGKPAPLGEWEKMHEEYEHLVELLEDYRGVYRASAGEKTVVRLPSRKEREREERLREVAPVTLGVAGMAEAEYEKRMDESDVPEQVLEAAKPPIEQRVEPPAARVPAEEKPEHAAPETVVETMPVKARPRVFEVEQIRKSQAPETGYRAQKIRRPERTEIEALARTLSEWKNSKDVAGKATYEAMLGNVRNASDPKTWNAARSFVEKRGYHGWKPQQFKDALALHEAMDSMDTKLKRGLGEISLREQVETELQEQILTLREIQNEDPEDFTEYLRELGEFITVFRRGGNVTVTPFGKTHVKGKAFHGWKVGDFERLRDAFVPTQPRADRRRVRSAPRSRVPNVR